MTIDAWIHYDAWKTTPPDDAVPCDKCKCVADDKPMTITTEDDVLIWQCDCRCHEEWEVVNANEADHGLDSWDEE